MFLAPVVVLLSIFQGQAIDSDIYFSGAKSGSNHFEVRADNSIDSVTKVNLQGFDIDSHLIITKIENKATSLSFVETMKQGAKTVRYGKVEIKDGKAKVYSVENGTPIERPTTLDAPIFATFHPQAFESIFNKIKWDQPTKQELPALLVEAGIQMNFGAKPIDVKTIIVEGKPILTRYVELTLASAKKCS